MADISNELSVDWWASPRIITVAAPRTEITIQDLVDSLRLLEDDLNVIDNDHLIDATGKENLGGGTLVGITATLQNAKLAFEARGGPSFELCKVSGGNLVAVDENGSTFSSPIEPTAYVQVIISNSSSATLQEQVELQDLWTFFGLDSSDPMTISSSAHSSSQVSVTIADNGDGSVTLTRQ